MNDHERAICRRMRELRTKLGWTQTEFAHAVGTSRDQLASIEYGRNPLRYWLADRVCEKLGVCQQWLACGDDPARGYVRLPSEIGLEIKPKEIFSAAWRRRVGHLVKRHVKESEAMKQIIADDPNAPEKILENRLYWLVAVAAERIPPELLHDYFNALTAQTSTFINSRGLQKSLPAPSSSIQAPLKKEFDIFTGESNNREVKSEISETQKLRDDLKRVTAKPGMKAALARFMKVAPARVSEWLSGQEPGGEYALKLRVWADEKLGHKRQK